MTDETRGAMHLWWNGYDQAPGRTADEAQRWMMQECGGSADDCEGDGWGMLPDDEYMRDEGGSIAIPSETAAQCAAEMIATTPLLPSTPETRS